MSITLWVVLRRVCFPVFPTRGSVVEWEEPKVWSHRDWVASYSFCLEAEMSWGKLLHVSEPHLLNTYIS